MDCSGEGESECLSAAPSDFCTDDGFDYGRITCSATCTLDETHCGRYGEGRFSWATEFSLDNLRFLEPSTPRQAYALWPLNATTIVVAAEKGIWSVDSTKGVQGDREKGSHGGPSPDPYVSLGRTNAGDILGSGEGCKIRYRDVDNMGEGDWKDIGGTLDPCTPEEDEFRLRRSNDGSPMYTFAENRIWRLDGNSWIEEVATDLTKINDAWANSEGPVVFVGDGGKAVYRCPQDGATWATTEAPETANLYSVWGAGDTFYAAGEGRLWRLALGCSPSGTPQWTDICADSQQKCEGLDRNLQMLWGSAPDNVFAVGSNLTLLHYDGSSWAPMNPPSDLPTSRSPPEYITMVPLAANRLLFLIQVGDTDIPYNYSLRLLQY
ncbi:MAG: hypothetical protein AAGC55_02205 [Myxococcota bacterium]